MKKSHIATLLVFLILLPLTLYLGTKLSGRGYYITGTLIIIELMIPFFMAFEGRKPQARELVVIAVMCAIAIAGRVAIPIPNFKATFALIMLAGIAFGPEAGFMIGAITAFVSNFFYWQASPLVKAVCRKSRGSWHCSAFWRSFYGWGLCWTAPIFS